MTKGSICALNALALLALQSVAAQYNVFNRVTQAGTVGLNFKLKVPWPDSESESSES